MTEQKAIYEEVSALLVKLFEVDPQDIKPEARLYDDLELDSIDAVDMIGADSAGCRRCGRTPAQRSITHRVGRAFAASRTTADRLTAVGLAIFNLVWPGT